MLRRASHSVVAHKQCLDGGIFLLLQMSGLHEGCPLSVTRGVGSESFSGTRSAD